MHPHSMHPPLNAGAIDAWPALREWDEAGLCARAGSMQVTVDVTPNGRGDAVTLVDIGSGGAPGMRGKRSLGLDLDLDPDPFSGSESREGGRTLPPTSISRSRSRPRSRPREGRRTQSPTLFCTLPRAS